jgi:TPR repeat protein
MLRRAIVCALAAAVAWGSPVRAQDGWDEIGRGDLAAAGALWRPRAETGDVNAMVGLAHVASMEGRDADAALWYHRAATRGHAGAQVLLASAYLEGRGVARDPKLAYAWYHLAAEKGHANAAHARDLAGRWLTPDQRAEARAMARLWQVKGMPEAP